MGSILVVDVGTSGLRAAIVRDDATIDHLHYRAFAPSSPFAGLVEFDAAEMGRLVLEVATAALRDGGPVDAVGVTTQRASTVMWDANTGRPLAPALGWQDLRTVMECIVAKAEHGLGLAPNQTATKAQWLLNNVAGARDIDVRIGTVDTWVVHVLSGGGLHVTDHTNAAVTGLAEMIDGPPRWHERACSALGVPTNTLARIVDSSGVVGEASALPGSPPIASISGDQQASLIGQSCVRIGQAKCTFGTGGMFDVCLDDRAPSTSARSAHGTFPIVARSSGGRLTWGAEAIMLSAGTNIEWLADDLGIIDSAAHSHEVASACDSTDGVVYVPALLGLGTPRWDYGARGTLLGLTRGSGRPQIVRAVLEGVAHRGADLLTAVEADHPSMSVTALRVDGGLSRNPTFVQALADACGRPVEVSPVTEATTLGAAYLAGLAMGTWSSLDDIERAWRPLATVEPRAGYDRVAAREIWERAVTRAAGWIPDLSNLDF